MKTFITIIAGLLATAGIIWAISIFGQEDRPRQYSHEFFINGSSDTDFNFTYELGIYSTEISSTSEIEFSTASFDATDSGFDWIVSAQEVDCSEQECVASAPRVELPGAINDVDNTRTRFTLSIEGVDYQYELVVSGFEMYVESSLQDIVSNKAQLYPDSVGRVVIDKPETPEDCEQLTRIQIERLITQNEANLAEDTYPGISETELDSKVIFVLSDGREAGDLLAVDSFTQCKTYIDVANLDQVGPQASAQ